MPDELFKFGNRASAVAKANAEERRSTENRIKDALPILQEHFETGLNSWEFHLLSGIEIHTAAPLFTKLYRRGICNRRPAEHDSKGRITKCVQRQAKTDLGDVLFLNPIYKDMDPAFFVLPAEIPDRKIHWRKRMNSKGENENGTD
jgi:hypothetical protein